MEFRDSDYIFNLGNGAPHTSDGTLILFLHSEDNRDIHPDQSKCEYCHTSILEQPIHLKANLHTFCKMECLVKAFVLEKISALSNDISEATTT